MTKAEQREAAEVLRRVVERIEQGDLDAPGVAPGAVGRAMLAVGVVG